MLFFQEEGEPLAAAAPGWLPQAVLWLLVALLLACGAGVCALWLMVARLRVLEERSRLLEALGELRSALTRLVDERDDLDLRRIEHVLIDLRDTQRRLEDALLRSVEGERSRAGDEGPPAAGLALGRGDLAERVVNRFLSLGYERVEIVTRPEKLSELAAQDGEVLVEARRQGVLHKGRVLVRGGRIASVDMHPAYSIFP